MLNIRPQLGVKIKRQMCFTGGRLADSDAFEAWLHVCWTFILSVSYRSIHHGFPGNIHCVNVKLLTFISELKKFKSAVPHCLAMK